MSIQQSPVAAGEEPLLEPLLPRAVKPIAVAHPIMKASGLGRLLGSKRKADTTSTQQVGPMPHSVTLL